MSTNTHDRASFAKGDTCLFSGLVSLPPDLFQVVRELKSLGAVPLVVGGAVRDALLGVQAKDIDIEVYGISLDQLADFLRARGCVDLVGSTFGATRFRGQAGNECDFTIPRRDSKIGSSHRDFETSFDPNMTIRDAAARRDFTINAMAFDPISGELHDYFGGRMDLGRRVLRAISSSFKEDPLRVLRGAQFACRFDLDLAADTAEMCKSIADQYDSLPKERVCEEFVKWATKSMRPGRLIGYLEATGWLAHFAPLDRLRGVPQDPEWHPEGNVATHTMYVVDAAAQIAVRERLEESDRAVLMFAALTHDLAKFDTTALREVRGEMRWTSYGHEKASGTQAEDFLRSIGIDRELIARVVPLVQNHLAHYQFQSEDALPRTARRLAKRLAPANIRELALLMEADCSGRPPLPAGLPEAADRMLRLAADHQVETRPERPLIWGRHVLPYFSDRPGKHIGPVVKAAYEAQLDGAFGDLEGALMWLRDNVTRAFFPSED